MTSEPQGTEPRPVPGQPLRVDPPAGSADTAASTSQSSAAAPEHASSPRKRQGKRGPITLKTRLVGLVLSLLLLGSFVISASTHATMSARLNGQLQDDLRTASDRAGAQINNFITSDRPAPSGVPAGTITGAITHDGSYAFLPLYQDPGSADVSIVTLSDADARKLLAATSGLDRGQPRKVELGIGNYLIMTGDIKLKDQTNGSVSQGRTVVAVPTATMTRTLATLDLSMALICLGGTIVVGAVGSLLITRALRPLARVSAVASTVAAQPLERLDVELSSVRVTPHDSEPGTEVGNVGQALNNLLDNVDGALEVRAAAEERMRRFAADASHELRTPLAAVQGYSELLSATESLSDDGERSLGRVREQTKRMAELVESLLLLSRLDNKQPTSNPEDVDLTRLACDLCLDFEVAATDHTWEFVSTSDEPVVVRGDENQIHRVVQNLMSNARKHTSEGTRVTVTVGHTPSGGAQLKVHDTGEGIAEDFKDKVFDRFARADAARSGATPTTGLGLAIVKAIVESHGGTIRVDSQPGDTTFTVELPQAPVAA
ncbi:cell wall metabolism sensor histidine kinase WalK [Galactobacter sp.]|uniref:sensor histidine kinase n=1 Tax=Galactobacter sp. TaxID=2676125 RepID=UPI0025B9D125|nr:HAMP domain-containing sensor histidine kinase [Galactobacter sp.]